MLDLDLLICTSKHTALLSSVDNNFREFDLDTSNWLSYIDSSLESAWLIDLLIWTSKHTALLSSVDNSFRECLI